MMGWITVAAYFSTSLLCAGAAKAARSRLQPSKRYLTDQDFWRIALLLFLLLGINKQLDLQSLLTELGRIVAQANGVYGVRKTYQLWFFGGVFIGSAAVIAGLLWCFRRSAASIKLAIVGLTFTSSFVVIRAASFHHVDALLGDRIGGWRWNWIIELTGIAVVAAASLRYCASCIRPAKTGGWPEEPNNETRGHRQVPGTGDNR